MHTGEPPIDVAIHELGGHGPTLLFSHATGFHGRCYQPIADALTDRFRCVAFDYRGHGDTPLPDGWEVTWPGYAEDVAAVTAPLDTPVVAFGHSMGGACLLMVAREHPDWFERLVLYEPVVIPDDIPRQSVPNRLAEGARRRRATFGSLEEAYDNYASKPPMAAFTPEALRAYIDGGFAPVPDGVRLKCEPEHEATTFEMGITAGVWSILSEVDVPVAILRGDPEGLGPAPFAPRVADRLPQGRLVELPHLDHFGPMTSPDELAKLVD